MTFFLPTLLLLITSLHAKRDEFAAMSDLVNQSQQGWMASVSNSLNFDDDEALSGLVGSLDFDPKTLDPKVFDSSLLASGLVTSRPRLLAAAPTTTPTTTTPTTSTASSASNGVPNIGTLDLRTKYPHCKVISTIRNQGACGSCWAVSAMTALADRHCIKKGINRSFASQDVMECCTKCTSNVKALVRNACNGGVMPFAFEFAQLTGITTGEDFGDTEGCKPYFLPGGVPVRNPPSTCSATCTNPRFRSQLAVNNRVKSDGYKIGVGAQAIKDALDNGGSVVLQMAVYSDFYVYRSGIYRYTTGYRVGGHGIRVIGYGGQGKDAYWLAANSWGSAWGENGFFRIARGTDECKIESSMFAYAIFN